MTIKTKVREFLIKKTGYWIYKHNDIPIGCDLITDLSMKLSLPIHTIFDVGANIGQTSLKFNKSFPNATIYAFEPISNPFQSLVNNTKVKDQIKCFNIALGDKKELIEIAVYEGEDSVFNSLKKNAMNKNALRKETVSVVTGDSFCYEHAISEIDLLKIDTEGYEMQVLSGFSQMFKKTKIKAVYSEVGFSQLNDRNTYINSLLEFALQYNFSLFGLYEVSNLQIKTGFNYGNILLVSNKYIQECGRF